MSVFFSKLKQKTIMIQPPLPEPRVDQLKRYNTAPELRRYLKDINLSQKGTKSDVSLRLVKHNSGILNVSEVEQEFTIKELTERLKKIGKYYKKKSKSKLAEVYIKEL